MALSNVEKKVGVTVTVDATGALKAWKEYQRAQEQAKKSTEDMAKKHGVATKEMAAAIKHQEKLEKEAARARKQATDEFKARTNDNLAAVGRFTAGIGVAAIALDKASQRQLEFSNIARNLRISIDGARESTAGMVSNLDLMRSAAAATGLGVVKTSEEFKEFAEVSLKLAAKNGLDAAEAQQRLTLGIARRSTAQLDDLGITLKVEDAERLYAKQLGKSAKALNEVEKAEAFRVIAMQKARASIADVTVDTKSSAAEVQRFKVTMVNAMDASLEWGASMGNEVVGGMSSLLNTVSLGAAGTTQYERAVADAKATQDEYTAAVDRNAKALKNWIDQADRAAMDAATLGAVLQGTLTGITIEADRLAKVGFFQAQTEQRIAGQVHQLDLEEAKLKAIGGAEKDIVAIQDTKRALLMEEAALRGDILEVINLTRQEELAAVGAPRKGGGGDRFASQRAAFEAELAGSQRAQGFNAMNRDDQTARGEFGEQLGIAQRNQAIAEAQAQHNAIMEAGEQEHLRKMEEARKAAHEANLKRIAAEKKAREDALRHQQAVQRVVSSLMHDSMGLAEEVAIATASSQRTATLIQQGFAASRATVTGIEQTVLAAAAFASLNPVQGALHAGAAALAYAKAGLLAGGVIGPGAGSSGGGGGGGSSSFGGGGSSGGGSRSASGQSAPISRKGEQHASPAASSGGGGFNGTIIFQSVLPADEEKAGHKIRQLLQHSGETFGSN